MTTDPCWLETRFVRITQFSVVLWEVLSLGKWKVVFLAFCDAPCSRVSLSCLALGVSVHAQDQHVLVCGLWNGVRSNVMHGCRLTLDGRLAPPS